MPTVWVVNTSLWLGCSRNTNGWVTRFVTAQWMRAFFKDVNFDGFCFWVKSKFDDSFPLLCSGFFIIIGKKFRR